MKRFALILITILLLAACAEARTVNLRLGPEGEILGWLALGPFANPGTEKMTCRGFDTDCLFSSEAEARPVEGQSVASTDRMLHWRLALADSADGLNFLPLFDWHKPGVAYAYAAVVSPSAKDARLLLGSDDGVKVWVNGELIHTNHITRGAKRDDDKVDIRLNAGVNHLLFKIDQHFAEWGLVARIAGRDGNPIPDLVETLNVLPKGTDTPSTGFIHAASGKSGALDMDALSRYVSWMHKTDIWMPWFRRNQDRAEPYDKVIDQIKRKVDAARSKSPSELSGVLKDTAKFLEDQYKIEWDYFTKKIQNPEPLVSTSVKKEDYVRVAPGGRYFMHADGSFYTPIGYNHNPDWPNTGECAPGSPNYDPQVTERFFKHLHESGVNLIRLMFEAPLGDEFLEKPVGTFLPEHVAWIDNIVTLARKYDIKLMVTPWDTFWMSHRWEINPYNIKNGGMVDKRVEFITKPEAVEAQKKRWKFIIDRWGNTGTIFCWELLNECDLWWEASPDQLKAWAQEMGDYVREYEKRKWGRNHIMAISIANAMPKERLGELAYGQPGMDFATTHLYIGAANAPDEPIGPALAEQEGVTYAMSQIKDNRPYIDSENGPINRWIKDGNLDDEVFHNMSWAHLASGGAGSGLRWPYRFPHHLSDGMYHALSLMSKFAKDVPWQKLTGPSSEIKVTVSEGWAVCSTGTRLGALVWVTTAKPSDKKTEITFSWQDGPRSVRYRCYDTKTDEWIAKGTASSDKGAFAVSVDGGRGSVALVLE